MSTIPTTIQVGPLTFAVVLTDNDENLGETRGDVLLIEVRRGLPALLERETLMHEIIHAAFFTTGLKPTNEERIVAALSPVLMDTIQRTAGLSEYLFGAPTW